MDFGSHKGVIDEKRRKSSRVLFALGQRGLGKRVN